MQIPSEPKFRTEGHIPEGYLTSVSLFLLVLVVVAFTFIAFSKGRVFREVKKKLGRPLEVAKPRFQRLSGSTALHFVDYGKLTILVVESKHGIALEVVDKPAEGDDDIYCSNSRTSPVTKSNTSSLEKAE